MSDKRTLALTGATALLGKDLVPVLDAVVVVAEGRIASAGPSSEVRIPPGADVERLPGGTLVPGFIDCHVHVGLADPRDILRGGVTTVRDLAWPPKDIFPLSESSRSDGFQGPLILKAGPMLTAPGGYPLTAAWAPEGTGLALTSRDEARVAIQGLVRDGVDVIKIALNPPAGAVLDAVLVRSIVEESHAVGLKTTAHIHGLEELHKALDAGVDELAHMLMSPERIPDATIQRMVQNGVVVVATLSIFPRADVGVAISNLARFLDAGGKVVYGTDLGNAGPAPGIDGLEVTRMEAAGMAAVDIIRSATVDAGTWLDLQRKGALSAGMDADMVLLEGDVSRASDLTRVTRVWRGGRLAG